MNRIAGARGRSLIEMIVAMAIGVSMSLGMMTVYIDSRDSSRVQDAAAQVADAGRHAMQVVSRQLRVAGYHRQAFYDDGWVTLPEDGYRSLFGCSGGFTDPAAPVLVCRDDDTLPDGFVTRHAVDIVEDIGGPTLRTVRFDPARGRGIDCVGDRVPEPADPAFDAFQVENRWYVATNAVTGLRELYCMGVGRVPQPVADGVEDLVLRYAVDRIDAGPGGRDLSADTFVPARGVDPNEWEWNDASSPGGTRSRRVVGVDVCLLVRGPRPSIATTQDYVDCRGVARSGSDGFYRQTFRARVALRNHLGTP